MRFLAKSLVISAAALLSACSTFSFLPGASDPIPTPIAANPASLRIAVLAPEEFRLPKGEIELTVYQRGAGGDISQDYMLVNAEPESAAAAVAEFRKPGQVLTLLRLSPADALRLRDQQEQMAVARNAAGSKPGFEVDLDSTCWNGPLVAPVVPLDVLIRADSDEEFHPLLSDIDIFELMNRPEDSRLKRCS
ncbi:hypothetical protein [Martelella soudanensis]|uniref:hypothetical protein n=1 Tax=unclassified Martelella TaxID=2629616 RepID=UPI0015E05A3E|nr:MULTISPECIES: hypothetical protein [unclassified Martelella]